MASGELRSVDGIEDISAMNFDEGFFGGPLEGFSAMNFGRDVFRGHFYNEFWQG